MTSGFNLWMKPSARWWVGFLALWGALALAIVMWDASPLVGFAFSLGYVALVFGGHWWWERRRAERP